MKKLITLVILFSLFASAAYGGFGDTWASFGPWSTGENLVDPGADRIPMWDDSAGIFVWTDGTTPLDFYYVADDGGIGISTTAERIIFDADGDDIELLGAEVLIAAATGAPAGTFEVRANVEAGTTVGDFLVDADNKTVYVGRLSTTGGDNSVFVVRNRLGSETFAINVSSQVVVGAGVPFLVGGGLFGTPDEITATDSGVAASLITTNTEVTTNGDSDVDNVTLANGTAGQIKHIYCVVEGAGGDTWKITPATMAGGTQITFAGVGEGCTLVYADSEGWTVTANQGGIITDDVMQITKTVMKTIDLNDDASTDDFQFDDDAANSTAQNVDMGAIIPAYAEVVSVQVRCFETVGAGTFQVTLGTASAGAELLAQATLDAANEMDGTATGAGPKLEATNAAKNVWIQGDPSGNWADAGDAGRWIVLVTYIDYTAAFAQKNP